LYNSQPVATPPSSRGAQRRGDPEKDDWIASLRSQRRTGKRNSGMMKFSLSKTAVFNALLA